MRVHIASELKAVGYRVCEAANADAALRVLAEQPVDILFTDVDMPGSINGLELALLTRARLPLLLIIITSGHLSVAEGELPSGSVFLTKPYLTDQIVAAIRRLSR